MIADLHIHSCLSPCGSLKMSPSRIVDKAMKKGLGLIAICDHNSARNLPTLFELCQSIRSVRMIAGIEVCSNEEIHLLCYFQNIDEALDFGLFIEKHLPPVKNRPEITGDQVYVDKDENILGKIGVYLGNATTLTLESIVKKVRQIKGLVIPAHTDRPSFSMISQLGVIPDTPDFRALEYQGNTAFTPILLRSRYKNRLLQNSDAHFPDEIAKRTQELPDDICDLRDYRDFLENLKDS